MEIIFYCTVFDLDFFNEFYGEADIDSSFVILTLCVLSPWLKAGSEQVDMYHLRKAKVE